LTNISEIAAIAIANIGKLNDPTRYGFMALTEKATNAIENALMPSGVDDGGIRSNNPPAANPSKAALVGFLRTAKLITKTNVSGGTNPGNATIESQVDSTIPLKNRSAAINAILIALMMHFLKEKAQQD
jgi:hypothetical protein